MLELVERFHRVRDRALFIGSADDVVADVFGPGLPRIRAGPLRHFDFTGYITGFEPTELTDVAARRAELGYDPDDGSASSPSAAPASGRTCCGARSPPTPLARDPGARPAHDRGRRPADRPRHRWRLRAGVEVHAYVPDLHRHLAVCDLAVVQGGLTTTMELTADGPTVPVLPPQAPLRAAHPRPPSARAVPCGSDDGVRRATPEVIAAAIADEIDRPTAYRPVETDGAARAATALAELL
jgi:hypothetical protein